mgnify:CR=1 FL=1
MKDHLVKRCARDANPSSVGLLITATTTLLKYRGISAQSVAWSQISRREAIIAGAIDAGLR